MSVKTARPIPTTGSIRTAGWVCFWGGLIGAGQALGLLAWPAAVDDDRYSYPFSPTGYTVAQTSFFVQHLALLVGLAGLLALPMVRQARLARIGLLVGTFGVALLAAMELVAISAADVAVDSSRADLVSSLYGIPTVLAGIGLTTGGVSLLRTTRATQFSPSWLRLLPVLLGVYIFVPMLPALLGPDAAGRLAIGGWMLLFAALGWGLSKQA